QWTALIDALKHDKNVYVTMLNGTHIDSVGPDTISRWLEFLDIYVAGRVPSANPLLPALASAVYSEATGGAPSAAPPAVRFTNEPSLSAAQAAFAAQDPRVRVLFDNGGGSLGPGALQPTYEGDFSTWPPAGSTVRYSLGPEGTLATSRTRGASTTSFLPNPAVRPADDLSSSANAWAAQPPYNWTTVPAANGIAFETPVFTQATTFVGPASLDLELESTAAVTDLQVTVTEVEPGAAKEEYITSGFLRSSYRGLSSASTALDPVPSYLASSQRDLPHGRFALVRIPVDPIAHTFRPGTRMRIVISAPGGDRPSWAFDTPATNDKVRDTVAIGGAKRSSFVIDEVTGVDATVGLPACGSLRGEPCRSYSPLGNQT
ncbi:MAG: CocE/NonD family hydrolase C-terminal non-catalytic domain-containing protein, partial [Acidimicrobiales bacterium]